MEDLSDCEDPAAPLPSPVGARMRRWEDRQGKREAYHEKQLEEISKKTWAPLEEPTRSSVSSTLDPNVPAFVPRNPVKQEAVSGPSLVFGGGGDFLSKYRNQQRDQTDTQARQRKKAAEPPPKGGPATGSLGASGPDRMNVQLNSMLVHSRHHDKILQVVDTHFEHFNAVNLITALHRLATVVQTARKGALRRDVRFKRLIHRLSDTLRNADDYVLKPQDLSNVAWALTKLGLLNAVLFAHLSDHIIRTMHNFEPVNLSMTLWAFARSGFLDEKLFRCAAAEVKRQLPDFQPQQIANTTWAMAKSGFVDEEVFLSAANLALQKLSSFQPMNYSMLLYSFALAKLPHPLLFHEVGQRCTVEALSSALSAPHVVTNLALAFSDAGVVNHSVFNVIAQVAASSLYDFRTQQIATLTQAFAKAEVQHKRLFTSISAEVVARLSEFKQQDLQDLLQAYKTLEIPTVDIARAIDAQETGDNGYGQQSFVMLLPLLVVVMLAMIVMWHLRSVE